MSFIAMETQNPLGQRPLNLMSRSQGLGWLGAAPTPGDYDNNQQVLGQLVAMGAISQDDANAVWSGTESLDDLPVNMTMINQALALTGQQGAQTVPPLTPTSSPSGTLTVVPYTPTPTSSPSGTPLTPAPAGVVAPAAAPAAQIPPGSTIQYTVTYSQNISTPAPTQFISQFAAALAALRYSMVGSSLISNTALGLGSATIQFQILDSVGNALLTDAKGNLDAIANKLTYNSVTSSTVPFVVSGPGVNPAGTPNPNPNPPANFTAWIEQNVGIVVGVVLAAVILPPLIRKL